ncbi:MAG: restriction endonuclease subunit S [Bacilli bacterium]|nr:restriction endonuclease subunit S [Bacilli bacterium]
MNECKENLWMGNTPSNWKVERLQWHLDEINQKNSPVKTSSILSLTNKLGVVPYSEKGNQGNVAKESIDEYKLAYPDTIVANSMNILIGSVGYCNYYGCVSPVYYVYKSKIGTNIKFVNYVFQTQEFQKELRKFSKGILEIRLRVSSNDILKRKVAFPSKNEQDKIVETLAKKESIINQLISNQEKQIEKLKEYRQAIIMKAVTKGLDPNAPMKDSGIEWIGKVPLNWMTPKFKNLATLSNGREIEEDGGDIPVYGSGGIFKYTKRPLFEGTSLLTGRKGTIDNPMLVNGAFWTVDTMFYTSSINLKRVLPEYLFYAFKGCCNFGFYKSGSVLPSMTQTQINNITIPLPTIEEQKQILAFLKAKMEKIDSLLSLLNRDIEKLNSYKKSLIYEYVTGKKRVSL